ncbi:MAG: globin domain-containing protein [Vicinamibacterales bacterium]
MTEESIARVQASYEGLARESLALSARFYEELFRAAPALRPLFPQELASLQGHFEAALALVVRNLREMAALRPALRDLGAQHVGWGARPDYYLVARDALVAAIRALSGQWDATLEQDWRRAVTEIIVPMLEGAAVATALAAERLADQ